jgi:hypothetical protein
MSVRTILLLSLLSPCVYAGDPAEHTLCRAGERIFFSCTVKQKTVSICASPAASPHETLEYRYGRENRVQMTYSASVSNQNRFYAFVAPAAPAAHVNQVWFDRGPFRYLVTQCEGGDCPNKGGLIVYKKNKPILAAACEGAYDEHAWFDPAIVDFGSSFARSTSKSKLVVFDQIANDLEALYPGGHVR